MQVVTESGWADLQDRVSSLEAGQRMIAAGHVQLVDQIAEVTVNQHRAEQQRKDFAKRLEGIAATLQSQDEQIRFHRDSLAEIRDDLRSNTTTTREILEATRDLRDVVITAKTGGRLAKWAAPTLVAVGVSVGIVKGWAMASWEWLTR